MIRKLLGTVVLILIGAGRMYYSLGDQMVKTEDVTSSVPNARGRIKDTCVNITEWEKSDFQDHPELTKALIDNGHEDLVPRTAQDKITDWLKKKAEELLEQE